jgi:hypothetical protein
LSSVDFHPDAGEQPVTAGERALALKIITGGRYDRSPGAERFAVPSQASVRTVPTVTLNRRGRRLAAGAK